MVEKNAKLFHRRLILVFVSLALLMPVSVALYIFSRTYAKSWRLGMEMTSAAFESIMNRTIPALVAMSASAVLIAVVSLSFQIITQSRILTPSMIGFDSVFVGTQTFLVFSFGTVSRLFANPYINYLVTAAVMIAVSMLMYSFILRKNKNNIIFLLMFGLVLSGIVGNGARYLQIIMSTDDFYQVQAATSVTINNMNTSIIRLAVPIILVVAILIIARHRTYDVMGLGAEQAKSFGVAYEHEVNVSLILIAVGMSVATALIGSLTFLGLLVVNVTRELLKTHKPLPLFIGSAAISVVTLILGQSIVELLQGAIPVTVIINLTGCSYMFYLILKENRYD